jgi:hypothetical protein
MRRPPLRPHFDIDRPNDFQARSSRRMNQMSRSLPYLVFLPPVSDTPFGIGSSNNCRRAKFVTMTATGSMPRHDSSKTRGLERRIFCSGGIQITTHDERICHRNGQQVAVPGRETSVSRRLRGVSVAGFGQLFSSRGQIFAQSFFAAVSPMTCSGR